MFYLDSGIYGCPELSISPIQRKGLHRAVTFGEEAHHQLVTEEQADAVDSTIPVPNDETGK